jgi:hypothetical protein
MPSDSSFSSALRCVVTMAYSIGFFSMGTSHFQEHGFKHYLEQSPLVCVLFSLCHTLHHWLTQSLYSFAIPINSRFVIVVHVGIPVFVLYARIRLPNESVKQ